jgi:hypothetical protein
VTYGGLIGRLRPAFLVLRPFELERFSVTFPHVARNYAPLAHIRGRPGLSLERWGYKCHVADDEFSILQRVRPPTERGPLPPQSES